MKKVAYLLVLILSISGTQFLNGQEEQHKIEVLSNQKNKIIAQEKELLKEEVEAINKRLDNNQISAAEAKLLKEAAAKKRALNIENRIAIIDAKIALLQRNDGELPQIQEADTTDFTARIEIDFGGGDSSEFTWTRKQWERKNLRYDRRTYNDLVIAFGLNNALVEGQSIEDTPYKIGGSRFFELGWVWRTRVFKNTNILRFHYGFSFQFNGLKPKDNQYFTVNNGVTELEDFDFDLEKSKFRMDNLVFPVHFEFGPSKFRESEKRIRYSINNRFRFGIGAYGGFNLGTRQKLKYNRDGDSVKDKFKRSYNTSNFVYGLSSYMGVDGVLLYLKYDLNPIFKDATVEQRNISLGLRFDL